MVNRLFVTSLKSIGLVSEGDNPESDVVIWKSHSEREIAGLLTTTSNTETVDQRIASMNQRLARFKQSLADLNQRIDRLKKKRKNLRPSRLATIPDERNNPMTTIDKETPLNELVKAKLDAYARRAQFQGEIAGKYGYLSTPREEMVTKIKSKFWDTPDGEAVKDLLRERGGDPADDLSTIAKSHSEAYAAIGRLEVEATFGG